jgi:hypothetical protein
MWNLNDEIVEQGLRLIETNEKYTKNAIENFFPDFDPVSPPLQLNEFSLGVFVLSL